MMDSLKEWATIVKALENGDQTIILRKGGILETASGFRLESEKFLLFPTYEHQQLDHIKPEFHKYLKEVKQDLPKDSTNNITSYAQVLDQTDVTTEGQLQKLSDFHIWSDSYITERRNWMPEKPIKAVFLKVYKIQQTQIPLLPQYQGCKSWIDVNVDVKDSKAVLSEQQINSELKRFEEATN